MQPCDCQAGPWCHSQAEVKPGGQSTGQDKAQPHNHQAGPQGQERAWVTPGSQSTGLRSGQPTMTQLNRPYRHAQAQL